MGDRIAISIDIDAPTSRVWAALTEPKLVRAYMMGATVSTDWKVGHKITWSGQYNGKSYVDRGEVKALDPQKRLSVTHWSPLSGLADEPANYHTVTYDLAPTAKGTKVTLTQENLTGVSEEQSRKNWQPVLRGLKETVEAP
jgi:uncharacterized protein YndB with AHSA1/START domain